MSIRLIPTAITSKKVGGAIYTLIQTVDGFDRLTVEVIDDALKYCLGETNASVIYNYLEKRDYPLSEIPNRPEKFSEELRNILGFGSRQILGAPSILEEAILEILCKKTRNKPQSRKTAELSKADKKTKGNVREGRKQDMTKQSSIRRFDQILLESIDESLLSLGENVRTSIYFHLEDLFKIRKQEIPNRLSDFSNALKQIFGLGAKHLEIMFMKRLHAKVEAAYELPEYKLPSKWIVPEMTFQEYVDLMRPNFEGANEEKIEMGILVNEREELQK